MDDNYIDTEGQCISFYRDIRCANTDLNNDGDMLLIQWGLCNLGKVKFFEFDITRQFIEKDNNGNDSMSQLNVTLYYQPDLFVQAENDNQWFGNPNEHGVIERFLSTLPLYKKIENLIPIKRDVRWEMI